MWGQRWPSGISPLRVPAKGIHIQPGQNFYSLHILAPSNLNIAPALGPTFFFGYHISQLCLPLATKLLTISSIRRNARDTKTPFSSVFLLLSCFLLLTKRHSYRSRTELSPEHQPHLANCLQPIRLLPHEVPSSFLRTPVPSFTLFSSSPTCPQRAVSPAPPAPGFNHHLHAKL